MELTILGKYGPYPKAGGACSGYLVKNGGDTLLLDCGSGVLSRLLAYVDITQLSGIFISHLHYDHTSDLLPLCYLLEELQHTITVYTAFDDSDWYRVLFRHPHLKIVNIDEKTVISLLDSTLRFVKLNHTGGDFGIIIEGEQTLCYTGDTARCAKVEQCCRKYEWLLMDCSKPSGFRASHMTVDDAREMVATYPCRIIATHQSADYDPAQAFEGNDAVLSAEEGKTIHLT